MKALILAAGKGSNLFPFNTTRPKPMINVAGKLILEHTITHLKESGISDINLVIGHQKKTIKNFLNSFDDTNFNFHCIEQKKQVGIGDAILQSRNRFEHGEYFMLVYGDILTADNIYGHTLQSFGSTKSPVASICLPPSSSMFGNVYLNGEMKITKVIEKPKKSGLGNYVLSGIYILPTSFFEVLNKNKKNMERALAVLIEKGELIASIWEDDWIDVAYPWDILSANKIIMDTWKSARIANSAQLKGDVKINGPVIIDENVEISSGTVLEGPCYIGKNSFIGNNVLVRKYTSIGPRSLIGYGVELKNSIIFGDANVGRLSFIGDSVMGHHVYIGPGTMTINRTENRKPIKVKILGKAVDSHYEKLGTFAGDNVFIGASNTLLAGTIVPSGKAIPHNFSYPK